jgi:hypothetical protein
LTLVPISITGPVTQQLAPGLQFRAAKLLGVAGPCLIGDSTVAAHIGIIVPTTPSFGSIASPGPLDLSLDGGDLTELFSGSQIYAFVPAGAVLIGVLICG